MFKQLFLYVSLFSIDLLLNSYLGQYWLKFCFQAQQDCRVKHVQCLWLHLCQQRAGMLTIHNEVCATLLLNWRDRLDWLLPCLCWTVHWCPIVGYCWCRHEGPLWRTCTILVYTICVCASLMVLRYRTITLPTCHFHLHSHPFLINSHRHWGPRIVTCTQ